MEPEQRALRLEGIGGSEIAALVGANPYQTPHDLWAEKIGLVVPPEVPSYQAYLGQQLQGFIAGEFSRSQNVRLRQIPTPYGIIRSSTDTWVMGSPDYLVDADPTIGVEIKMAGLRQADKWGPEGTDQIPTSYLLQCQWYAQRRLLNAARMDLGVLLGQEFRVYKIEPHPDLQEALFEIAARFWFDHVLPKVPPPMDHSDGARRLLDRIYPIHVDDIRAATDEEMALATSYRQQQHAAQEAEIKLARLRNLLCDRIGMAEGIVGPDFKLTWKRSKDGQQTDWEGVAQAFRKLGQIPDTAVADILRDYTTSRPGQRRFRSTFHESDDN